MKVLVLCTGNSCRSILAEAILRDAGFESYSAGSAPAGRVNENVKRLLEQKGLWSDEFYSKSIDEVEQYGPFDLVVTVCDNAKEACPTYPGAKTIHMGYPDPDGKPFEAFEELFEKMQSELVEAVKKARHEVEQKEGGVQIKFKGVPASVVFTMVQNCSEGKCECMSEETKKKIEGMQIDENSDDVSLHIKGDIKKEEIEAALKRSKVLK